MVQDTMVQLYWVLEDLGTGVCTPGYRYPGTQVLVPRYPVPSMHTRGYANGCLVTICTWVPGTPGTGYAYRFLPVPG